MTPVEYLPFERGLKDGLSIYWERLKTFLTVMFISAVFLGIIGSFFVQLHPPEKAAHATPDSFGSQALLVIGSAVTGSALVVALRRYFRHAGALASSRLFLGMETAIITIVITAMTLWGFSWEIAIPSGLAVLASLVDGFAFARRHRDEDPVRRPTGRDR